MKRFALPLFLILAGAGAQAVVNGWVSGLILLVIYLTLLAACARGTRGTIAHRDLKPENVPPPASDGSRFWGRRNAEATNGKVVTKESGGSRERAAEALAAAAGEPYGSVWSLVDVVAALDAHRERHVAEANALRGEVSRLTEALDEAHVANDALNTQVAALIGARGELRESLEAMRTERDALALQVNKPATPNEWSSGGIIITGGTVTSGGTVGTPPGFTWSSEGLRYYAPPQDGTSS